MSFRKLYRPWGRYDALEIRPRIQIKRSTVLPGAHLTLQKHRHRAEHRVVVSGEAQVTCADEEFTFQPMESTFIPAGTVHRLEITRSDLLEIIEVQTGSYPGEGDFNRS